MSEAKRFPRGCVASPHHLASSAGLAILARGGNAVDAAVATSLTLGVVSPYMCGYGGDLFSIVWRDGLHAYNGSGRAPAAATADVVRDRAGADVLPTFGPLTVTVPGAVDGWFTLIERFGTRSFEELAATALRYARDGFLLSERDALSMRFAASTYQGAWAAPWHERYAGARPGQTFMQPGLARTIEALGADGPDVYYRGPIGEAIAATLLEHGAVMTSDDLAEHRGDDVELLSTTYRGVEIFEHPPNSQGVAALEALNIVEGLGPGRPGEHVLIEAMKLALADRDAYLTDPAHMRIDARELASEAWADARRPLVDAERAGSPAPGRAAVGGTIYLCAADEDGMCVSLIQSNYMGFGSGVHVPGWGINLQNRGAYFSLDPEHVNVIAPRKRTLHTLMPAFAMRDGRPWLVFGTMGGDGQAQTHLQVLTRVIDDDADIQEAIDAPRWSVVPTDWAVAAEPRFGEAVLGDLRERGHGVSTVRPFDTAMGHAHGIAIADGGYAAASDPRSDGAAMGL